MKRNGLSWDGGKKRIAVAVMLLAVLVTPGAANALPQASSGRTEAPVAEVELIAPVVHTRSLMDVSWS